MPILLAVHVLAAAVWVGGMFFAYLALRPAALTLEPPLRLTLWAGVLQRFFRWVLLAVMLLPLTGYLLVFGLYGGLAGAPLHVQLMQGLGWLMILAFLHVYFAPYRRLQRAVTARDWAPAGRQLGQIRWIVLFNLILGLTVIAIAAGGRYGLFTPGQ